MTRIFFITNNALLKNRINYKKELSEENEKERKPLSVQGEKIARELLTIPSLLETKVIYSSNYISMINSAKYLCEKLGIPLNIDERLKERKVGILNENNEKFLKEMQEHDFDYKLHNGESLNQVKERMKEVLKEILKKHSEETITIYTHDIALESLFSIWCEKGFNLENQLILNFKDNVIIDGAFHPIRIFYLEFDEMKLKIMECQNKDE